MTREQYRLSADRRNFEQRLIWVKDFLFPFIMAACILIAVLWYRTTVSGSMEDLLAAEPWFEWVWLGLMFLSCTLTAIGVILRGLRIPGFIWFEYPGSIVAAFTCLVYTVGIIIAAGFGSAALSIAVSFLIGLHFLVNFVILHTTAFKPKPKATIKITHRE